MPTPEFREIKEVINERIEETSVILTELHYEPVKIVAKEFYDFTTGPVIKDHEVTLRDALGNEFLMVHELVEACEIKKTGNKIVSRALPDLPKEVGLKCHFTAFDFELDYALLMEDFYWVKHRMVHHKKFLEEQNLSDELKMLAETISKRYQEYMDY